MVFQTDWSLLLKLNCFVNLDGKFQDSNAFDFDPAIYCRKLFGVINYVTYRWMSGPLYGLQRFNLRGNFISALEWG